VYCVSQEKKDILVTSDVGITKGSALACVLFGNVACHVFFILFFAGFSRFVISWLYVTLVVRTPGLIKLPFSKMVGNIIF
jgi:hypothetical protein